MDFMDFVKSLVPRTVAVALDYFYDDIIIEHASYTINTSRSDTQRDVGIPSTVIMERKKEKFLSLSSSLSLTFSGKTLSLDAG